MEHKNTPTVQRKVLDKVLCFGIHSIVRQESAMCGCVDVVSYTRGVLSCQASLIAINTDFV